MQFNFKTLWGSERPWGGPKGNGWSCTWVNCWGGGWEYQDAGNQPQIWNFDNLAMQCLPLYTILLALGNPAVHFFSLDIEGAELPVLKTVPWDKVDIRFRFHSFGIFWMRVNRVLTVETHFAGQVYPGDRREVIAYMEEVFKPIHYLISTDN